MTAYRDNEYTIFNFGIDGTLPSNLNLYQAIRAISKMDDRMILIQRSETLRFCRSKYINNNPYNLP